MILSTGGNVQIYETTPLRSGQLVPWRMARLGQVSDFVHARREICQNTQSVPQVAILHSETHYYSKNDSGHLLWGFQIAPVNGAAWCISDCHRGVDILDEYMLKSRADEFPVIVVPDQIRMSDEMVSILKDYTEKGGILILSHPEIANRFGYDFTGVKSMETETEAVYYLPVHGSEAVPMYSGVWGKVVPADDAEVLFPVLKTPLTDDEIPDFPAAVVSERGKGKVVFLPMEIFMDYANNRYPGTASFMDDVLNEVWTDPQIKVRAGAAFDFVVRKSEKNGLLLHFINRSSGLPLSPGACMIDEIPPTGPVKVSVKLPQKPESVKNLFPILSEEGNAVSSCSWIWEELPAGKNENRIYAGTLHVMIPLVKIHDVIQIQ